MFRSVYDDIGQLICEDNSLLERTYVYAYDDAGNILSKKTYALTAAGVDPAPLYSTYSYGYTDSWGDLLTSYRGVSFTYDEIGNPLTYYNGSSYTFTWENGRRLKTATVGSNTLSFTYNHDGIRTSKTVNGVVHNYTVSGSLILTEEWGTNLLVYLYDANGAPIGMRYRTSSMAEGVFYTFWFDKNLQGDVVAVYNETGTKVLSYTYDAWGNKTTTVHSSSGSNGYAQYNAITYRGYYFDSETNLYYVSSRYYDAKIGRFINADAIGLLGANGDFASLNLFAYCGNNPVSREDEGGEFWNFVVGAVVGAVIGAVTTAVDAVKEDGWDALTSGKTWAKMGVSAACGAINGTVAASGAHVIVGGLAGSATGFLESLGHELIENDGKMNNESWSEVATDTAVGFLGGLAGGHGAMHGNKYMAKQTTRLAKHIATDGIKKAGSFYLKMTVNYSKQFVKPTLQGLAKGWVGGKIASALLL